MQRNQNSPYFFSDRVEKVSDRDSPGLHVPHSSLEISTNSSLGAKFDLWVNIAFSTYSCRCYT